MRKLTTTLCLTIALLLGGLGWSESAESPKNYTTYNSGAAAYDVQDYKSAFRIWLSLAQQGYAKAQAALGLLYLNGRGVSKNEKTAAKWIKLAAEQGHIHAQFNLAGLYFDGRGIPQDYVYAHMWYNIHGGIGGRQYRDIVAKQMTSDQIATAQKLARECVRKKYKGC